MSEGEIGLVAAPVFNSLMPYEEDFMLVLIQDKVPENPADGWTLRSP